METYYQVLTAEGRGAIAVVRVWGPGALGVADAVFRPHKGRPLNRTEPGRLRLGRAGVGAGDEVVSVRLPRETPTVEIQCHGGTAAVAAVVLALEGAGAVREPVDVPRDGDGIRAQALEDLAAAPTLRSAEILLDQANGALSRSLETLIADAESGAPTGPSSPLLAGLEALIHRAEVGTRLLRGWKVVIAGRPNVGKSRLFNALAGFERSIVNPRAGVTRDVITIRAAFGGWPVELADTAGERESRDAVERLGIGRARLERGDADLVLLVLDRSEPLTDVDRRLVADSGSAVVVGNKCDLPPAWAAEALGRAGAPVFILSAESGQGIEPLVGEMASRLVPNPPAPGAAVPFRPGHRLRLEEAREHLREGDVAGLVRSLEGIGGNGTHAFDERSESA